MTARGSVFQRKDGRWVAQVTAPTGKQHQKYSKTKGEAEAKLAQLLVDLELGADFTPSKLTVDDHMTYYLQSVRKVTVAESTWKRESAVYRKHVSPRLGSTPLPLCTTRMLQALVGSMSEEGYASRTIHYPIEVMKRGLDLAVNQGLIQSNPALAVALPPITYKKIEPFEMNQLGILWDCLPGVSDRQAAAFIVAAVTGLRWGEVFGLSWDNVFPHNRELLVDQQLSGKDVTRKLKTKNSRRRVPLPDLAYDALIEHRDRFGEGPGRLVFFTSTDTPFMYRNVYRTWGRLLDIAGLPGHRFHDLRHTAATNMIKAGVDMRTVMEILGHGDIQTTMNTYAHVLDSMRDSAREKLNELYSGGG